MPKNIHHLTIGQNSTSTSTTSQDASASNASTPIAGAFGNQPAINLPKSTSPSANSQTSSLNTPIQNSSDGLPKKTGIYFNNII